MSKRTLSDKLFRNQLLAWYDANKRDLPWRDHSAAPDPYKVWLSEIMLQQTTVTAVKPYYQKFLQTWPALQDMAHADKEDIMAAWAGLGYYSRARNLHACAQELTQNHNSTFPQDIKALKKLPGIGDYTSGAIRAIAFNKPATVIDGNVERVLSRFFAIKTPMPAAKKDIKAKAQPIFENNNPQPSKLAQAFMDLGTAICTPKNPKCQDCPLNNGCEAYKQGRAETFPVKAKKKARPQKYGYLYWIEQDGKILTHKRPDNGLLGGMLALPSSDWVTETPNHLEGMNTLQITNHKVTHTFTHFDLELSLVRAKTTQNNPAFTLRPLTPQTGNAMPSVFKKAYKLLANNV